MKQIYFYLPVFALACLPAHVFAQPSFDANVGFGTAHDNANGAGIDTGASSTPFSSCSISSGDAFCQSTPKLDGLFMNLGGDVMFNHHLGAGFEYKFQPSKSDYGPLNYRQSFIDANIIFKPIAKKRWGIQLEQGIGAARTGFSFSDTACVGTAVCVDQSQAVGTTSHFEWHTGAGVELLLTNHVVFRPQFDLYYVPNLNQQFGNNAVPMVMFNIGYTSRTRD